MEWDEDIAAVAQAYAETLAQDCSLVHSSSGYGENLFAAWGIASSGEDVVEAWASEEANYDYDANTCSDVCGHYTQVVWADSSRLGCGRADCFDGGEVWVCNYDPPGNFNNRRPY